MVTQSPQRPEEQGAVFVEQLDDGDGRIPSIGQTGVRIAMLQQTYDLADLQVLQFTRKEHAAMARRDAFATRAKLVHVGHVLAILRTQLDTKSRR